MALGCLGMTVGMATTAPPALYPDNLLDCEYFGGDCRPVLVAPHCADRGGGEEPAGVSLKSSLQAVICHRGAGPQARPSALSWGPPS